MALMTAESGTMLQSFTNEGVVLVEYGTPWCPPCKTLLGVLEELDGEMNGKARFVKVNCDDLPDAAAEAGVLGTPTVVVYKDGVPMDKLVGLRPKAQYRTVLERYL
ncbi:thioredoxin family protein [Paenibacillus arenilitoris]|uniref:Thioredoxin n=1 Tax=Paenibacillus arenilitoris TaxID=2772299 RepID=A0A927CTW2_9BACL|nr:thioredoxin domain-containing protein [Paenibacillus arenilitoris]MBD2872843.1 thioredoxin fold domain-containing protein [Paenibacillus arenilitoris]